MIQTNTQTYAITTCFQTLADVVQEGHGISLVRRGGSLKVAHTWGSGPRDYTDVTLLAAQTIKWPLYGNTFRAEKEYELIVQLVKAIPSLDTITIKDI